MEKTRMRDACDERKRSIFIANRSAGLFAVSTDITRAPLKLSPEGPGTWVLTSAGV